MKLNISDIQRFSTGDGPGIRTTVFFKGCNLHCPWCHNPETISAAPVTLHFERAGRTQQCGRWMEPQEVCDAVLRDADFFAESGGGVTLSGGEVLLQPEGAAELAQLLKAQNIHVILDTAGDVPYEAFEAVAPWVDEYYFDWKAPTSEAYRQTVGGDCDRIYSNLSHLLNKGRNVRVRIPLIEGFNTGPEAIAAICETLRQVDVAQMDLLPFHRMGSAKYAAMGKDYAYVGVPAMNPSRAEEIAGLYRKYFNVRIEK